MRTNIMTSGRTAHSRGSREVKQQNNERVAVRSVVQNRALEIGKIFKWYSVKWLPIQIWKEGRKDLYCHCTIENIYNEIMRSDGGVDQSCKLLTPPHTGPTWPTYFLTVGGNRNTGWQPMHIQGKVPRWIRTQNPGSSSNHCTTLIIKSCSSMMSPITESKKHTEIIVK